MVEQGAGKLLDDRLPFDFGDVFAKLHAEVEFPITVEVVAS
jgi:hypothetical protein